MPLTNKTPNIIASVNKIRYSLLKINKAFIANALSDEDICYFCYSLEQRESIINIRSTMVSRWIPASAGMT